MNDAVVDLKLGALLAWCNETKTLAHALVHELLPTFRLAPFSDSLLVLGTYDSYELQQELAEFHSAIFLLPPIPYSKSENGLEHNLFYCAGVVDERRRFLAIANGTQLPWYLEGSPVAIYDPSSDTESIIKFVADKAGLWLKERGFARQQEEPEYLALTMTSGTIRVVSLTSDGRYQFIDDQKKLHRLLYQFTPSAFEFEDAIRELEAMIGNRLAKEADFQRFFERHPLFILGEEHKQAHARIVLSADSGELIPDFVLEPLDQNGLCDVLELKRPTAPVFILKANRFRFSAAVEEARAQLMTYERFFEDQRNREVVLRQYGLHLWRPRLFVVIGRRADLTPIDRRAIELGSPMVNVHTYDDVLARMKYRLERIKLWRT